MKEDDYVEFQVFGETIKVEVSEIENVSERLKDLADKAKKEWEEKRKEFIEFDTERRRVFDVNAQARKIEKSDVLKAIELYESVKNHEYNRYDTLGRLMILYRRTKQFDKEIETIKLAIPKELEREKKRMNTLIRKYPEDESLIKDCFVTGQAYKTEYGNEIDFYREINKLKKRLLRAKSLSK